MTFELVIRSYLSKFREEPAKYYVIIFLSALLSRLIWFLIVLNQVPVGHLGYGSPSSDALSYLTAADAIRTSLNFVTDGVYSFGPGYPSFLALARGVVGTDPRAVILIQILLSATGSVLLAGLAFKLTADRRVAILAGMLNALSVLSWALATVLLSETLFFALAVGSFLVWLSALERNNIWLGILAGILFSAAALTRSVSQFLVLIAIVMAILKGPVPQTGRVTLIVRRLKLILPAVLMVAITTGAWTLRNDALYHVPYLSGAAPKGLARFSIMVESHLADASYDDGLRALEAEVAMVEEATGSGEQVYLRYAASLPGLIWHHPVSTMTVYLREVIVYTNTDWGVVHINMPRWDKPFYRITRLLKKTGLIFRITILSIIGLAMLYRSRRTSLAVILLAIYAYFAFFCGFNPYQGSRIFYPGQIAWTILVSFPLLYLWDKGRAFWLRKN